MANRKKKMLFINYNINHPNELPLLNLPFTWLKYSLHILCHILEYFIDYEEIRIIQCILLLENLSTLTSRDESIKFIITGFFYYQRPGPKDRKMACQQFGREGNGATSCRPSCAVRGDICPFSRWPTMVIDVIHRYCVPVLLRC